MRHDLRFLLIALVLCAVLAARQSGPSLAGRTYCDFEPGDFGGRTISLGRVEYRLLAYGCGGSWEADRGRYEVVGGKLRLISSYGGGEKLLNIEDYAAIRLSGQTKFKLTDTHGRLDFDPGRWNGEPLSMSDVRPGLSLSELEAQEKIPRLYQQKIDDCQVFYTKRASDPGNQLRLWCRHGIIVKVDGQRAQAGADPLPYVVADLIVYFQEEPIWTQLREQVWEARFTRQHLEVEVCWESCMGPDWRYGSVNRISLTAP